MKNIKYYIKTISLDELAELLNYIVKNKLYKCCFIMNLSDRNDKKGYHHWIAIYIDIDENDEYSIMSICYYDSYGDKAPVRVRELLKNLPTRMDINYYIKYKENQIKQQEYNSELCGFYCIAVLLRLLSGLSWKESTNYIINEDNMKELKDKYDKYNFI
jgi:hypothetical protein